jgi:hypothetical protein
MKQKSFKDKYPIFYKEFLKTERVFQSVTEFLNYFEDKIEQHAKAVVISRFDHFTHTQQIEGSINPEIKDAQNIIMCFGWELPSADPVSVRPRAIGVTEMSDRFIVNFMEAPNPIAQQTMTDWVESIK